MPQGFKKILCPLPKFQTDVYFNNTHISALLCLCCAKNILLDGKQKLYLYITQAKYNACILFFNIHQIASNGLLPNKKIYMCMHVCMYINKWY